MTKTNEKVSCNEQQVYFLGRDVDELQNEMMMILKDHKLSNPDHEHKMVIGDTNRPYQCRYEYWFGGDHIATIHSEALDKFTGKVIVTWLEWNDIPDYADLGKLYFLKGWIPAHITDLYDTDEVLADELTMEYLTPCPAPEIKMPAQDEIDEYLTEVLEK